MTSATRSTAPDTDRRRARNTSREHRQDLRQLPNFEQTIEARIGQLVDADLADPPPYLRSLGPKPTDAPQLAEWRRAAEYVERYRTRYDITDLRQPLGPQPAGDATMWRYDLRDLAKLAERARTPGHDLHSDVGLGLG